MPHLKSNHPAKYPSVVDLRHPFVDQLQAAWLPQHWIDSPIVLAVSGGSDSVALLLALDSIRSQILGPHQENCDGNVSPSSHRTQGKLIVGHFHHGLRGSDADGDATFVQTICRERDIAYEIGYIDSGNSEKDPGEGWESTLRQKRYAFLLELAERHGARYVATGHTAEDQVETILHRVVRGTGLRGLAGMPRSRALSPAVSLIRPMLTLSRELAQEYLTTLGAEWRTDPSNESFDFTRNRIRHELLPLLQRDFNPQVSTAILRLGQLAGEAQQMVDGVIAHELEDCYQKKSGEEIHLGVRRITGYSEFLVRELFIAIWREAGWPLQAMGLNEWQSLAELLRQPDAATLTLPGGVVAKKEGGKLSLRRPH